MAAALVETGRARVQSISISGDLHPVLGPALAHGYLQLIEKYPGLWDYLYDNQTVAAAAAELRQLYHFLEGGKLRARIRELSPDVIVCTHALSYFSIASEKEQGNVSVPLAAVITDYGVHAYWTRFSCELFIVPTEELAQGLADKGLGSKRILAAGIPIHPAYERALSKVDARRRLGVDEAAFVVLLTGGSKAIGGLMETADALLQIPQAPVLLAACGANDALRAALEQRYRGQARVRPFPALAPAQMAELFCAADLLVGKAGGLTCAEALAVGLPAVFVHPIPGQEERNVLYLTRQEAALRVLNDAAAADLAAALFDDPPRLAALARRAKALGRPAAAREAAEAILKIAP